MKIFETNEEIKELITNKFDETGLPQLGINLKIISVTKAKNILKATKAGATVQYLTNKDVFIIVYEEAFERLSQEMKERLIEGALSNISYNYEKDKLNVEGDIAKEMFRMRRKYENYVDMVETAYIVIETIEDEERRRKEEEKLKKAEERAAKKRNQG